MYIMSKNTISLEEFQAGYVTEVRGVQISSNLNFLPYAPTDQVAVDLGRIARIAKIGRLNEVEIGQYHEQDETYQPTVSGLDDNGTATASQSGLRRAQLDRSKIEDVEGVKSIMLRGHTDIKINFAHPDISESNPRDPKNWSKVIDLAIKDALKVSSARQLFTSSPLVRSWVISLSSFRTATSGDVFAQIPKEVIFNAGMLVFCSLLEYLLINMNNRSGVYTDEKYEKLMKKISPEYSIVPFLPIDRFLAVTALTGSHSPKIATAT